VVRLTKLIKKKALPLLFCESKRLFPAKALKVGTIDQLVDLY
jgi:hypothetical protein